MTVEELILEIEAHPEYQVYVYDPSAEDYVELTGISINGVHRRVYMQSIGRG